MENTPCAVTVGTEHRRDSPPGQGKQVSLGNTDFHHSTGAQTENAALAVSRQDRSQGVHKCTFLAGHKAVTWHSDATNVAPATRWQVGLKG